MGHQKGDEMIKRVADVMSASLGNTDSVTESVVMNSYLSRQNRISRPYS